MARSTICLGFVLLLGACIAEAPEPEPEVIAKGGGGCPIWECGSNSPVIDNYGFHELNVNGLGIDGFKILSFSRFGVTYRPLVFKGKLSGRNITNGIATTIDGANLVNAVFRIQNPSGGLYDLKIKSVDSAVSYWARSLDGQPHLLESYELEWTVIGSTRWKNVCDHAGVTSPVPVGMNTYHTLLFEGDHIDPATRTVTSVSNDVFTLGCAGSTPAKMALIAHTHAAELESPAWRTSLDERSAAAHMFGAFAYDRVLTVAKVKIAYIDDKHFLGYNAVPNLGMPKSLEMRWGPKGALCMNTARINENPTFDSMQAFPGGVDVQALSVKSGIPMCTNLDPTQLDGAHLVSANPY